VAFLRAFHTGGRRKQWFVYAITIIAISPLLFMIISPSVSALNRLIPIIISLVVILLVLPLAVDYKVSVAVIIQLLNCFVLIYLLAGNYLLIIIFAIFLLLFLPIVLFYPEYSRRHGFEDEKSISIQSTTTHKAER
jgi:hypothetical protein